jgi:hypothetical protein
MIQAVLLLGVAASGGLLKSEHRNGLPLNNSSLVDLSEPLRVPLFCLELLSALPCPFKPTFFAFSSRARWMAGLLC